eukprot:20343_1
MHINTMRYVVGPVIFGENYTLSIVSNINLQRLENVINQYLHSPSSAFEMALHWYQLELKQIKYWNTDKIVTVSWKRAQIMEFTVSPIHLSLLKMFINRGVYLKPSELSWDEFFQIIETSKSLIMRYANIFESYCCHQMLTDKHNKHHWEYCVSLLRQKP